MCMWNVFPGGRVTALVSSVIIPKYVQENYLAVTHSCFMHSVFYLAL